MDPVAFVTRELPGYQARVLEVGCGRGELARAIARLGYEVVAIDPDAPDGPLFEAVALEDFADPGPFDAVLAMRALHHITDLAGAVDKLAGLLRSEGRVIVYEHAWERFDERTARWYLDRRTAAHGGEGQPLERCLANWRADHADLHRSAAMLEALQRRFTQRLFGWTPYLHEELGGAATEQQEQALIDAGEIQATGFCYVGERRR